MKSFANMGRAVFAMVMLLSLCACAQPYGPLAQYGEPVSMSASTYNSGDALRSGGTAILGQVLHVRPVLIDSGSARQVGATVGGLIGTLAGMGHHNRQAPIIGGAVGAAVGYAAGSVVSKVPGVELIVCTQDKRLLTVVQTVDDGSVFAAGQPVAVLVVSGRLRVERV
jgi:outer membrane lipoprotein SlyB